MPENWNVLIVETRIDPERRPIVPLVVYAACIYVTVVFLIERLMPAVWFNRTYSGLLALSGEIAFFGLPVIALAAGIWAIVRRRARNARSYGLAAGSAIIVWVLTWFWNVPAGL